MQTRASVLVGRHTELSRLDRALTAARQGHGSAVFLVGEAGIGKSRLAAEVATRAFGVRMRLLRGRGSTIGPMVPFRPLTEALLSLVRGGDAPDPDELGPYGPVLGRLVPDWSRGEPPPAGGSPVLLAEAVLRLTGVVGRHGGCLMTLDDLQDADAETLAVVEYLVDNLDRQPTLLLGTVRAEPSPAVDLIRSAAQRRACDLIELSPLEREELRLLAASYLDGAPDGVPAAVLDRICADSAGNPFVVEELLNGFISNGVLVPGADGWRVTRELRTEVPTTVARSVARRADLLGPQGRTLLSAAAVLGRRFPLPVVQSVTGLDDRSLLSHLHAALAAQLVVLDDQAPDWYAFRHPLTAEALLAELTAADRAELARRAADAVEQRYPGMPGEWLQLAAALRLDSGAPAVAGRLLAEAGRRALAAGAATSAVTLLERARDLLVHDDTGDAAEVRADAVESLLYALAEAGQFDRAVACVDSLDGQGGHALVARRRAALHTRLAWAAVIAGRWADGSAQIRAARRLLGPDAPAELVAPVDAVAAYHAVEQPGRDRLHVAESLARRAAAVADAVPLPVVSCQAWQLIGTLARGRDLAEATACFERVRLIAQEHTLPLWQLHALVRLGGNDALADDDTTRLEQARQEALRVGSVPASCDTEAILAMQSVLRGEFAAATAQIDHCWTTAERLRLTDIVQYLLLTRAMLGAHQGRRREMDRALADFRRWGGNQSRHQQLVFGLSRTFCALLEEDRARARDELDRALAWEAENPSVFHLTGRHGLHLLLTVLCREAGPAEYAAVTAGPTSRLRWNRQFALLAGAVLAGRDGRGDEAVAAVAEAGRVGAPFRMARHLGLRLVAQAACEDGWGEPTAWLQAAEGYFHDCGVVPVAAACRALLRQAGATVPQRRGGSDRIPAALRALGVTVREYEVFELLVERLTNRAIAERLHISPRTVEKHVASLMAKTGQPDRHALNAHASATLTG
ncbi:AAA family ATPase [Planosporangium sp. 12N6]|uniref:ATP-binding protein n=1 Tax=Planosporangium spinosum TaxID=3402278 RepID=UPI003CF03835